MGGKRRVPTLWQCVPDWVGLVPTSWPGLPLGGKGRCRPLAPGASPMAEAAKLDWMSISTQS